MAFYSGIVAFTKSTIARASGLLDAFLPAKYRQVVVFDNEITTDLFASFNILSVDITQDKSVASHPLETNRYLQDSVVVLPKSITLTVAAEAQVVAELYTLLFDMYADPNALFAIQVDSWVHRNMVFKTKPIQREVSKYDVIEVPLVFEEFIFSRVKVSEMSDPQNVELAQYSDRQQKGFQKGSQVSGQDAINREATRTIPAG